MQSVLIFVLVIFYSVNCDVYYPDHDGAPCTTKTGEAGVCRKFQECEYAKNLVRKRKKIKDCFFDKDNTRYSCCVENIATITVVNSFTTTIKPTTLGVSLTPRALVKEGVMKTDDIECRFNGTFPVICCRVARDFTTLKFDEPSTCKKLKEPYIKTGLLPYESVIYDACYAYSRLGSKCVKNLEYTDQYTRHDCSEFDYTPKISDGDPAQPKEFPHMAVLGCNNNQSIAWIGGGSLISEYFILTAAHAVGAKEFGLVKYALLGTIDKTNTRNGSVYYITSIIRYPKYNSDRKLNDIGLMKLHTRVKFSEFIRPACLTLPGAVKKISNQLIIAGWGQTGERENTSDVLLKAFVYRQNDNYCEDKSSKKKSFMYHAPTMICALGGETRKLQDSCQGDSGGPLMGKMRDLPCSYFVAGIVSWGDYCGKKLPGYYTKASYDEYLRWIVSTVWPQQLKAREITLS